MTKLKTLKDIEGIGISGIHSEFRISTEEYLGKLEYVEKKHLRQEAIKWINQLEKEDLEKVEIFSENTGKNVEEYYMDDSESLRIIWIKHFFNITKEDLK